MQTQTIPLTGGRQAEIETELTARARRGGRGSRQTELSRNCQSKTLRADEIKSGWKLEVHISLSLSLISEKIMKYEVFLFYFIFFLYNYREC